MISSEYRSILQAAMYLAESFRKVPQINEAVWLMAGWALPLISFDGVC